MRIAIDVPAEKRTIKLRFRLPLILFKSRAFTKLMLQNGSMIPGWDRVLLNDAYRTLRRYIAKHGHFDLFNVQTQDGVRMYIRI